jgi:hypothetical protein
MEPELEVDSEGDDLIEELFNTYPTLKSVFERLAGLFNTTVDAIKDLLGYDDQKQSFHLFIDLSHEERLNSASRFLKISDELMRILLSRASRTTRESHATRLSNGEIIVIRQICARLALQFVAQALFSVWCDYCGRKLPMDHIPLQCNAPSPSSRVPHGAPPSSGCRRYFDVCKGCESTIPHGHFHNGLCFRHSPYYLDQWHKRRRKGVGKSNLEYFLS